MYQIKTKTNLEIANYENTNSDFADFINFEVEPTSRNLEREAFINNLEYTPNYKYPRLDFLIDNGDVQKKKAETYEAVMELEAAKENSDIDAAELELFACFHETRLKKIMLVEAARNLEKPISMSDVEINRRSFVELNESLYGEFDASSYLSMLSTERDKCLSFEPRSSIAMNIKLDLESVFDRMDNIAGKEKPLINDITMQKLHDFVINKYANVLAVVPKTPDNIKYNVTQCAAILNEALKAGGLADCGWTAVENSKKTNPSTTPSSKTINLPSDTNRSASELRRLIIHEQEVHARRAQNGSDSGLKPIKSGTANYLAAEEGLGVILECAVDGNLDNASFDRARNRYITAGLAMGADGNPRDAREVYEILWRMLSIDESKNGNITKANVAVVKNKAYTLVENAYRGTQFWMKGVIYTKLKIYYEGLVKNAEYFNKNIDNLDNDFDSLFIGKYDHTSPAEKDLVRKSLSNKLQSV